MAAIKTNIEGISATRQTCDKPQMRKNEAWENIRASVNLYSTIPRTLTELQKKWYDLKCRTKRKIWWAKKDSHGSDPSNAYKLNKVEMEVWNMLGKFRRDDEADDEGSSDGFHEDSMQNYSTEEHDVEEISDLNASHPHPVGMVHIQTLSIGLQTLHTPRMHTN